LDHGQFPQEQRDGRNPQTGKTIQIAAKNVVKFKGAELEGAVN
jgi:DNA-binding protein HU-beta